LSGTRSDALDGRALAGAGCRTFFVADLAEARIVRGRTPGDLA